MHNRSIGSWLIAFLAVLGVALLAPGLLSAAELKIAAMPSGSNAALNAWDSKPYTYPGNTLELWGRVTSYTGALPLKYNWNFGAGEGGSADAAVTNRGNIAASHAYAATGSNIATLTVFEDPASGGTLSASAQVFIDVVPNTLQVRKNLAIQRALKYLYMSAIPWNVNSCDTLYWDNTRWTGDTGLAVLAFEDYNHRASNDSNKDIFAETVKRGLWAIEATLISTSASNTPSADSDLNNNGKKTYEYYTGGTAYENGIMAMAIANSKDPTHQATCGRPDGVQGVSYQVILEDLVDFIAYAQEERSVNVCSGYGGWRYTANYCSSDNSVSQWPVLGLAAAAQSPWSISPPTWVKPLMTIWSNNSQNSNGAFGYTWYGEWNNVAKTGSGIIQMEYAGIGGASLSNAINYIGQNWCAAGYDYGNLGDHYAMYAVKKGLQYAGITDLAVSPGCRAAGTVNWQSEYDQWYVANQVNHGTNGVSWPGSVRIGTYRTTASFGLLVMAKGLAESPPVAVAGAAQEVAPNTSVTLNGSTSYHTDPTKSIVKYEWDTDYNGIAFDINLTGPMPTFAGYTLPSGVASKVFTVALRVTDNNVPPLTARDTTTIKVSNGNQAPVAKAGGPYLGAVGSPIILNGGGSYDANSQGGANPIANPATASGYDEIVKYEWDIDGDGVYGDVTGKNPSVSFGTFIGTKTIGLKVTDSFGASSVQSSSATTVAVSNVQPLCYVSTLNAYNPITKTWTRGWKLKLQNVGTADASAISAVLTSIPPGVTVLDGNLAWSGPIGAGGSLLSTDDFRYRHGSPAPAVAAMTWDITFTDALGTQHVIRQVPQGSGACAP